MYNKWAAFAIIIDAIIQRPKEAKMPPVYSLRISVVCKFQINQTRFRAPKIDSDKIQKACASFLMVCVIVC